MKKILYLLLITVFAYSCGNDDEPAVNPLVGEWELKGITITDPPAGTSLQHFQTEPDNTLFLENSYTIEFSDDFTYKRTLAGATVFNGSEEIVIDVEDDGDWERSGDDLELDQDNTNASGLVTDFTVSSLVGTDLELVTQDDWFAWGSSIVNADLVMVDGVPTHPLDTIDSTEELVEVFAEHGTVATMTFTMEFEKQ